MPITGNTAIVLMLAAPVSHIRGTDLINRSFDALGLDAVVVPLHVPPADLGQCLDAVRKMQNVAGLGITIPHKIAILPHLDHLTPAAGRIGAANWVRRNADGTLTGHNIDGESFVAGLAEAGVSPLGKRALVVGAGGVGRAIAFALAESGVAELTLANRSTATAQGLAADIAATGSGPVIRVLDLAQPTSLAGFDLVVNATSLGMHADDPLPIAITGLAASAVVAEVVVNPAMTPLLTAAAALGCQTVGGAEMLKPQPRLAATFFGLLPAPL